jgi:adenylate kinase
MNSVVIVGIPGAGKSSILKELLLQFPDIKVVNYGDKMLEEAQGVGITRDLLRKMPFKEQQQIGIKAAKKMVQEKSDQPLMIDTHALIRTSAGYCPGLPLEVLEILVPKACVWVECHPRIILQRRAQDPARHRDEETEEELLMHQELTRAFLTACSMHTGSLLCHVQNSGSSISQNAQPLIHLIRSLFPAS